MLNDPFFDKGDKKAMLGIGIGVLLLNILWIAAVAATVIIVVKAVT